MSQAIACPNDRTPGNLRVFFTNLVRDMGGCLTDDFQVEEIGDEVGPP